MCTATPFDLLKFIKLGVRADILGGVGAKIARRKTAQKFGGFLASPVKIGLGPGKIGDAFGFELLDQLLMSDAVGLPKLLQPPGSHGGRIHSGDVA